MPSANVALKRCSFLTCCTSKIDISSSRKSERTSGGGVFTDANSLEGGTLIFDSCRGDELGSSMYSTTISNSNISHISCINSQPHSSKNSNDVSLEASKIENIISLFYINISSSRGLLNEGVINIGMYPNIFTINYICIHSSQSSINTAILISSHLLEGSSMSNIFISDCNCNEPESNSLIRVYKTQITLRYLQTCRCSGKLFMSLDSATLSVFDSFIGSLNTSGASIDEKTVKREDGSYIEYFEPFSFIADLGQMSCRLHRKSHLIISLGILNNIY